ncbi:MAG: peptidylprolyl isomerase [Chthoniobacter sp.]|uniref:peptidylprolyl isomerase n=1 Tax=Chthoniobacter sp. TaxID=2510640 RepID=UPI0032A152D2
MKRILREPLLHFLLLGAVIFAAYGMVSKRGNSEPGKIVISEGQVAAMAEGFARTWRRPPTREEIDGLIRDRVQEEVYSREAVALGLDKDDTIIRRRLRQKMEFLTDDVAALAEPTDDDLGAYLQAHADTFRTQRCFTFRHVYLNPERHGENLARDAGKLLAQMQQSGAQADVSELGDSFLLEHTFQSLQASETVKQFGEKFAARLGELPTGRWEGPIESGYGVHLVYVGERQEGRVPALAEVRDAVRREWANTRRLEMNEKFYRELLKRYDVAIERPQSAEEKRLAEARVK